MKLHAELTAEHKLVYSKDEFTHGLKKIKPGNVIISITGEKVPDEFKKRTDRENKYYWGVVVKHANKAFNDNDGIKYSPEQSHDKLKENCNGKVVEITSRRTGEVKYEQVGLSTANLSTAEFETYLEKCRLFLNEWFGVYVPLPNESDPVEYL
jgi:hypothetical protein